MNQQYREVTDGPDFDSNNLGGSNAFRTSQMSSVTDSFSNQTG